MCDRERNRPSIKSYLLKKSNLPQNPLVRSKYFPVQLHWIPIFVFPLLQEFEKNLLTTIKAYPQAKDHLQKKVLV